MGDEGPDGDSSLLYHVHIPAAVSEFSIWELPDQTLLPNHPLTPRRVPAHDLFGPGVTETDAVTGRLLLLGNDDVRLYYVAAGCVSPYYRDAIGDECLFFEAGEARVETVFGDLEAEPGDYVIVPRGTIHRIVPYRTVAIFVIEASSHIGPPRRYLSRHGQMLESAPYCERDLRLPSGPCLPGEARTEVYLKHRLAGAPGGIGGTVHTLPHHPFDVAGWDGCLYPYAFSIGNFMPVTGKLHQPVPAHQVFEGTNFAIGNLVPRPADDHGLAVPASYYRSGDGGDEVIFSCRGDYEAGTLSLHPGGHPRGPQPGESERSIGAEFTDELAVTVSTCRPLELGVALREFDDGNYAYSWSQDDGS